MAVRVGKKKFVDSVNTFRVVLPRKSIELARIPYVFTGSQCFQGLECSSSPTSGTGYPLVRGLFALTYVQSLRWRRLTGWFAGWGLAAAEPMQVCGVAGSVSWLVGAPPAVVGLVASSFRFCRVGWGWPTPIHGSW
jgi:hypothetical protein